MKICSKCAVEKLESAFDRSSAFKCGRQSWCKLCEKARKEAWLNKRPAEKKASDAKRRSEQAKRRRFNNPAGAAIADKLWISRNPEKRKRTRRRALLKKYGLTEAAFIAMLAEQESLCPICDARLDASIPRGAGAISVDHCHLTNRVRGLLCNGCNLALGIFKDSEESLSRAIEYLRKSKQKQK